MSSQLDELKERSRKRRQVLAQQLGVDDSDGLTKALASQEERAEARDIIPPRKQLKLPSDRSSVATSDLEPTRGTEAAKNPKEEKAGVVHDRRRSSDDVELSEKVYTDSSAFLKG